MISMLSYERKVSMKDSSIHGNVDDDDDNNNDSDHGGSSSSSTSSRDYDHGEDDDDLSLTLENMNMSIRHHNNNHAMPSSVDVTSPDDLVLSSVTLNISQPYFIPLNERGDDDDDDAEGGAGGVGVGGKEEGNDKIGAANMSSIISRRLMVTRRLSTTSSDGMNSAGLRLSKNSRDIESLIGDNSLHKAYYDDDDTFGDNDNSSDNLKRIWKRVVLDASSGSCVNGSSLNVDYFTGNDDSLERPFYEGSQYNCSSKSNGKGEDVEHLNEGAECEDQGQGSSESGGGCSRENHEAKIGTSTNTRGRECDVDIDYCNSSNQHLSATKSDHQAITSQKNALNSNSDKEKRLGLLRNNVVINGVPAREVRNTITPSESEMINASVSEMGMTPTNSSSSNYRRSSTATLQWTNRSGGKGSGKGYKIVT